VEQSPAQRKWRVLSSYVTPWPLTKTTIGKAGDDPHPLVPYVAATLMVAVLTGVFWKLGYAFTPVNIALLYLLPVLVTAVRWGLWPSFYAAGIGVVCFDLFSIPPLLTFTVNDARYLISFGVYLAVAAFTASLASQLKERYSEARQREAVTSALFTLSTQVAAATNLRSVLQEIVRQARETFGFSTSILLPDSSDNLRVEAKSGFDNAGAGELIEPQILQWVYTHGKIAGYGTRAYKETSLLYVPLKTESRIHGVMCIAVVPVGKGASSVQMHVIEALASLAAVSVARVHLEEEAKLAQLTAESERLRTALLDSISHELRTPLATIMGAVTGIKESAGLLTVEAEQELLQTIEDGAHRMNRLVTNLLGMVRLESGMLRLNRKWSDISDMIGVALRQVQDSLQNRPVQVKLQDHLPAISVDDVLIEQVLANVLNNAVKYSPPGSPILLEVLEYDGEVTIRVRDWGIGIQADDADKIFDKFYRSPLSQSIPGTGLGLAICKGIIQAHGGDIFARAADDKGTVVTIRLPVGDASVD